MKNIMFRTGLMFPLALLTPGIAFAEDTLNSGDTAWMITATALVLLMTLPGLALFYGGMVRKKNVLSMCMQTIAIASLMSVLWVVLGYSLAFGEGTAFIGGLGKAFFSGVGYDTLSGTIPETVFATFQMTFAIITPVLIIGAFAERMKFSAVMLFTGIWVLAVYAPICHWVWGGGLFADDGVLDFAGGTVVHINAGVAGLVCALMLGKRTGYPREPMMPHNLTLTVIGTALLWVGWSLRWRRQRQCWPGVWLNMWCSGKQVCWAHVPVRLPVWLRLRQLPVLSGPLALWPLDLLPA
jgi:Amt family ammonium transporter